MSARQNLAAFEAIRIEQILDDRALRILVDGRQHASQAVQWAFRRNPFMAQLSAKEIALASYEVHRS
jgi:hypothetical protein